MASEARSVKTPGLEIWVAGNCSAFGIPPSHRLNESKQDEERQGSLLHPLGSPSQSRISAMSAGAHHVVICCADKTLWATGSNMFGQLGTGVDGVNQKELALLDVRLPIVSVSCGKDHTVVVTLYGEMLACGNNTSGQLGLGDFEDRVVLTKSDLMDMSIISVAAGDSHTLAVTKHGELYSFGNNCEGQLGISRPQDKDNRTFCNRTDNLMSTATPSLVQFEPELAASRRPLAFEVLQMCCGARHCAAIVRTWRMDTHEVISERDLYTWGSNQYGQLGKNKECQIQGTPRWVQIHAAQVRASLPSDFPDPPLKARRDDPSVMVWYESSGMSEDSQLQTLGVEGSIHSESSSQLEWGGYGEAPLHQSGKVQSAGFSRLTAARRKFEETISAQKAPTRISCGSDFTLVVTADGCVYACGRCDRGQLGVKGMKDRYAPTLVTTLHGKRVSDVACGREHAFAIVEGGREVFGWGRNTEFEVGLKLSKHIELPKLLQGLDLRPASIPGDETLTGDDELATITRSCATIAAGRNFSVFGRIEIDGFPRDDPAKNLSYNIPGDVLVCVLGTAIPRFVPYLEGSPPFEFSTDLPLPEGLHLHPTNGQLYGAAIHSAGPQLLRFKIVAHSKCRPDVTSTYRLQLRVVEPIHDNDKDKDKDKADEQVVPSSLCMGESE